MLINFVFALFVLLLVGLDSIGGATGESQTQVRRKKTAAEPCIVKSDLFCAGNIW